jgi:RNA polymerase sigma-70 factor (ECF subfamily)
MSQKENIKIIKQKEIDFCFGDNDAFAFLFQLWQTELFFYVFSFLKDEKETEDVLYDCFEKIIRTDIEYRSVKFIQNEIQIKAFLKLTLKNKALDVLKVKKNRSRIILFVDSFISKFSFNESIFNENKEFLLQLLKPLNERDKEILLMHIQGYSLQEIGCKYFLSKKTVSNIISSSKKEIRLRWQNNDI